MSTDTITPPANKAKVGLTPWSYAPEEEKTDDLMSKAFALVTVYDDGSVPVSYVPLSNLTLSDTPKLYDLFIANAKPTTITVHLQCEDAMYDELIFLMGFRCENKEGDVLTEKELNHIASAGVVIMHAQC